MFAANTTHCASQAGLHYYIDTTSTTSTPSSEGLGFNSACPPGFRTQLHVTTSLSTGGGPVSCVQLSEGGFQVVYRLGLWSRSSGVVKVLQGYG